MLILRSLAIAALAALVARPVSWRPSFEMVQPDLFGAVGGQANAWADVDGDGDLDYFVAFRGRPNRFYRHDRNTFRDVAAEVGLADDLETRAAAWGDFDADGDPDLYLGFADPKIPAKVYRNDAKGTKFVDVSTAIGVSLNGVARQPAWIDYDGDGDLDLFTANQEGEANGLYRQDRRHFADVAAALGVSGMPRPAADGGVGPSVADFDLDGDFDLFVANYGHSALYRNDGGLAFTEISRERGIDLNGHGVTSGWGDLDNDGRPDLYVGNFIAGQPLYRDALFMNGAAAFVEALPDVILKHDATHGVQFVDFDQDGRLDLALTNNGPDGGGHPLLRNTATMRGRSIAVEVTDPNARRSRAGSEVRAYRAGTRQLLSSAIVDSGSGYCSQSDLPVHLGIPDDWPGRVDIEVITIAGGARHASIVRDVNPDDYRGRSLRIITTR